MKTLKYSRQRESIKTCLMNRTDHPTADALYLSIREEFPNISLGTVYRNLNLLVELGEIISFTCGDGSVHFDYTTSPHYHFVCKSCGHIIDLPVSMVRDTSEFLTEPSVMEIYFSASVSYTVVMTFAFVVMPSTE